MIPWLMPVISKKNLQVATLSNHLQAQEYIITPSVQMPEYIPINSSSRSRGT